MTVTLEYMLKSALRTVCLTLQADTNTTIEAATPLIKEFEKKITRVWTPSPTSSHEEAQSAEGRGSHKEGFKLENLRIKPSSGSDSK